MFGSRHLAAAALFAVVCAGASTLAHSQGFPKKPVHIIVTTGSGSSIDLVARVMGQKLSELWGQQVVVDNKPGAGGIVAATAAAKSPADGYTLLMSHEGPFTVLPALHDKLAYSPVKDFAPISLLVRMQYFLVVNPAVPATSVPELVAYLQSRAGKVNYASPGNGTPHHLGMELFKTMAKVDVVHVPYKTNTAGVTDLLTGEVSLMFNTLASISQHVKAGKVRVLAVAGGQPALQLPNIPTVAQAGRLPGFEFVTWVGLFAPAGTPAEVIGTVQADAVRVVNSPDLKERFVSLAFEPVGSTSSELQAVIQAETPKWEQMVRASGAKVD